MLSPRSGWTPAELTLARLILPLATCTRYTSSSTPLASGPSVNAVAAEENATTWPSSLISGLRLHPEESRLRVGRGQHARRPGDPIAQDDVRARRVHDLPGTRFEDHVAAIAADPRVRLLGSLAEPAAFEGHASA